MQVRLPFEVNRHGWKFPNRISSQVAFFRTNGLCGGMALSAINYYRYGMPIPSLTYEQIPQFAKVVIDGQEVINVPATNPGFPHPVFEYIFHSQLATFQSGNIHLQVVIDNRDENHYRWSVENEFPKIKRALDGGCFIILGLRSPNVGDVFCGHQTLVYGYNDTNCTLYTYDSNYPNQEITVKAEGGRLVFSGADHCTQYKSYYVQLEIDPRIRTNDTSYDFFRNAQTNFSVKPTYIDRVSPALEPGVYSIQSKLSGKVLDIDAGHLGLGGRVNGSYLQQWDDHGGNNQKFKAELVDGMFVLRAVHSNKVLDVAGVSVENGANVQQWDYWGGPNQKFFIEKVNDGFFKIKASHSGKVLDVFAWDRRNGARIKQYDFHGGDNQLWRFNRLS